MGFYHPSLVKVIAGLVSHLKAFEDIQRGDISLWEATSVVSGVSQFGREADVSSRVCGENRPHTKPQCTWLCNRKDFSFHRNPQPPPPPRKKRKKVGSRIRR